MGRALTIAYVTTEDANDRRSWSGTLFHLAEALRADGHRLILVGPLRPWPLLFLCRVLNQLLLRVTGKRFHYRDSYILSKAYARIIERRLRGVEADLILAPAGLSAIAHLHTRIPIVHLNDRCLAGAVGYHRILRDVAPWSLRRSLALEQLALRRADLTIYASEWAAAAARDAEPSARDRIRVIPLGANLPDAPVVLPERPSPTGPVELLFIGVHWEHKGGPIAVEALRALGRLGVPARLVVCGCDVPAEFIDGNIVREGFLDKSDPKQRARLQEHLLNADALLLPTRFEAYGIAFCEAAAYGLPAFGTRTGGVPSIVEDGVTGHLFDPAEGGAAYAERIAGLVRDPERWQAMRRAARQRYERTLTWGAFVQRAVAAFEASGLISRSR